MPCTDCGQFLVADSDYQYLYCPNCVGIPTANRRWVLKQAESIEDDLLNNTDLVKLLSDFGYPGTVFGLVSKLNGGARQLYQENRLDSNNFIGASYIINAIYNHSREFHRRFEPHKWDLSEFQERIDALSGPALSLIAVLRSIRQNMSLASTLPTPGNDAFSFFGKYEFLATEYGLCSERCMRASIGVRENLRESFLESRIELREFDRTSVDEISSVEEFGDCWFELIIYLGFLATITDDSQGVFTTDFPRTVSIFQIEEIIERAKEVGEIGATFDNDQYLSPHSLRESEFDSIGRDIFGEEWAPVKESILMSEDSPDAHPLFFKLSGEQPVNLPKMRKEKYYSFGRILLPYQFASLLKFQIYPLLENGDQPSSKDLLGGLTSRRGLQFEKNVPQFLNRQGIDCYYSCEISKSTPREIDCIFRFGDTIYFTECKYLLPELNIQLEDGIKDTNNKFDREIFDAQETDGKPYPEKVAGWLPLSDLESFRHRDPGTGETETAPIPESWTSLNTQMLVVSNIVPSYIDKDGVRFLTDLEFYEWISDGEDPFWQMRP